MPLTCHVLLFQKIDMTPSCNVSMFVLLKLLKWKYYWLVVRTWEGTLLFMHPSWTLALQNSSSLEAIDSSIFIKDAASLNDYLMSWSCSTWSYVSLYFEHWSVFISSMKCFLKQLLLACVWQETTFSLSK